MPAVRALILAVLACACSSGDAAVSFRYETTVFIAPTWDRTADGAGEVDEETIRAGLQEIRDAFGTGARHGPHAQPAITFYCLYEGPQAYSLAADDALTRNLRLAVEIGLPYRIILHGGPFTGTECLEEPLQCFLKQTTDDWLMGDPDPFRDPIEGADSPPYVTLSRYHSVYYVRKMRNLRAAVRDLLKWIGADPMRRDLFIGFSKDPETSVHPATGQTTDPLATREFDAWIARDGIYEEGVWTVPTDHHPGATGVAEVVVGGGALGPGDIAVLGFGPDHFGLVLVDGDAFAAEPEELSEVTYTVVGGRDDGRSYTSLLWRFSDDPEGDGGEWMTQSSGSEEGDYRNFMHAMVDHHVEDVVRVVFHTMRASGVFAHDAEIRSYLYTHEVPGETWDALPGPNSDDYELLPRLAAPLRADPAGNWTSVAGTPRSSPGLDVFGILTRDRAIFDAARAVAQDGNWGLMEWNPGGEDPAHWRAALDQVAEYGVHVVSLQGWETIFDDGNEVARAALADFLVRMGDRPYRIGEDNR